MNSLKRSLNSVPDMVFIVMVFPFGCLLWNLHIKPIGNTAHATTVPAATDSVAHGV